MVPSIFSDLLILLAAGLVACIVCRRLQVTVLIGYLLVGVVIGDGVLGWVHDEGHQLAHFAEAGVLLLLFSIGLEFSIDDLKRLGGKFIVGGGIQMLLVAGPAAFALIKLGIEWQSAILIASAFSFSSTVLVFRALTEYGQAQQQHGQLAIGILLFQDAALVPLLLIVPLLTDDRGAIGATAVAMLAGQSIAFIVIVIAARHVLGRWVIPFCASFRSTELVVLFTSVSLGGVIMSAYWLGLSPAIGAFSAGLIFNGNRWSHQIDALVLPFRELFAAVFFVGLGMILDPVVLWNEPQVLLLVLPAMVLLKAFAAAAALKATGLSVPTSLGMGLGLAHIGEFAFVLVLLGVNVGVLTEHDYQRVVLLTVGSLLLAPLLMRVGLRLVRTNPHERDVNAEQQHWSAEHRAVVIGAGPIGRSIASQLETFGNDVCLVDLSPINLHSFAQAGFRTIVGDATDVSVLERAGVAHSHLAVVCLPDDSSAIRTVRSLRRLNAETCIMVRCRFQSSIRRLQKAGADKIVAEESEVSTALRHLIAEDHSHQSGPTGNSFG